MLLSRGFSCHALLQAFLCRVSQGAALLGSCFSADAAGGVFFLIDLYTRHNLMLALRLGVRRKQVYEFQVFEPLLWAMVV